MNAELNTYENSNIDAEKFKCKLRDGTVSWNDELEYGRWYICGRGIRRIQFVLKTLET